MRKVKLELVKYYHWVCPYCKWPNREQTEWLSGSDLTCHLCGKNVKVK